MSIVLGVTNDVVGDIPSPKLGLKVPFPTIRKLFFTSAYVSDTDPDKSVNPSVSAGTATSLIALIRYKLVRLVDVISYIKSSYERGNTNIIPRTNLHSKRSHFCSDFAYSVPSSFLVDIRTSIHTRVETLGHPDGKVSERGRTARSFIVEL
jgi:hypothetical protein